MVSLCVFLCSEAKIAFAVENDYLVPEEYSYQMDNYLKSYIEKNIPGNAYWVDSDTISNFVQTTSKNNGKTTNISDKVNANVYTFTYKENGESIYNTVIDICFINKFKTSKNDLLEVHMNDYLRPVSPAKGELLVKDDENQEWRLSKNVSVLVNLSYATVFGDQIYNNKDFSRIILSFSSGDNPDSIEYSPRYLINYTNQKDTVSPLKVICIVVILLVSLAIIAFKSNSCKGSKTNSIIK